MNTHPDIGQSGWRGLATNTVEQRPGQTASTSFHQYLDKSSEEFSSISPEKLTPETIRSLAENLIAAMDRASMSAIFFDTASKSGLSSSTLLSTDFFMAMRNNQAMTPLGPVQEGPLRSSDSASEPAVLKLEEVPAQSLAPSGSARDQFAPIIASAAEKQGLDPKLIEAVIQTESNFDAEAVSPVGAQGLMQLMPATAADLGVSDPFDPEQNIQAGTKYLKQLMDRYDGDSKLALAAYNWGMGNLERHPERMPRETVNYVAKITGIMNNAV